MFSFSLSSQIEYIVGKQWNAEYNKWLCDFCVYKDGFKYNYMSKINWQREIRKLPRKYDWYSISKHPDLAWDIIQANPDKPWSWNPRSRITTKGECPFGIIYHEIQI